MRWDEEIIQLLFEMECTIRGFNKKTQEWIAWGSATEGAGHKAYAARQAAMWAALRDHAITKFAEERLQLAP